MNKTAQRIGVSFREWWRRITRPSDRFTTPDDRRHSQFLAALVLMFMPLLVFLFAVNLISIQVYGSGMVESVMTFIFGAFLLMIYSINRQGYYSVAAWTLVIVMTVAIFVVALPYEGATVPGYSFDYVVIIIVLANFLLSFRHLVIVATLTLLGMIAYGAIFPEISLTTVLIEQVSLSLTVTTIIFLGRFYLQRLHDDLIQIAKTSQAQYRTIVEHSDDMIYTIRNGNFDLVNSRFLEYTGYTAEEVEMGLVHRWDVVAPSSLPDIQARENMRQRGETPPSRFEFIAKHRNGSEFDVEVQLTSLQSGEDTISLGIGRNVTQRKRREQALQDSESRFRLLAENSPDTIFILDVTTDLFSYRNRLDFLGYNNDELQGIGFWKDHIHPEDREYVREHTAVNKRGKIEYRFMNKVGDWEWLEHRETILARGDNQYPSQTLITLTVITERKQAEERLQNQREFLRKVIDLNPNHIFVRDWEGRYVLVNQAAAESFNTTVENVIGKTDADFGFGKDFLKLVDKTDHEVISTKKIVIIEEALIPNLNTGRTQVHNIRKIPILSEDGTSTLVLGVSVNITALKEAEAQRLELAVERERIHLLQRFISDMSHDLMTPISIIRTSLHLLTQSGGRKSPEERVATVNLQVNRLESMIQNMLMLSGLDAIRPNELNREPVDFNILLREISMSYEQAAARKQQHLNFLPEDDLPTIPAEVSKLSRAISNLLDNALQYTPEGGTITLSTGIINQGVYIEVKDTGVGIPTEELPLIFKRFYRGQTHRPANAGTGLGLSIAQKIIEAHGGSVEVESQVGVGSIFTIWLPLVTK